jgi:hypothetical protein
MRIDRLELRNFKKFAEMTFEFPRSLNAAPDTGSFHVLIGENGSGKTSVLDALAVALGVWLVKVRPTESALRGNFITALEMRIHWMSVVWNQPWLGPFRMGHRTNRNPSRDPTQAGRSHNATAMPRSRQLHNCIACRQRRPSWTRAHCPHN